MMDRKLKNRHLRSYYEIHNQMPKEISESKQKILNGDCDETSTKQELQLDELTEKPTQSLTLKSESKFGKTKSEIYVMTRMMKVRIVDEMKADVSQQKN